LLREALEVRRKRTSVPNPGHRRLRPPSFRDVLLVVSSRDRREHLGKAFGRDETSRASAPVSASSDATLVDYSVQSDAH
jgi:hypothetical protein